MKLSNAVHYPAVRRTGLAVAVVLMGMLCSTGARAAGCTGWGADTDRDLDIAIGDLSVPAGSSLATSWSEVLSGSSGAVALSCTDINGLAITNTTWSWLMGGSTSDSFTRAGMTTGIGLRLKITQANSVQSFINATDGVKATGGFNWNMLSWIVVYTNGALDISQPMFSAGPLLKGTLTLSDGSTRTLTIRNTTTARVVPECTVDTIPSIEFGNVSMLRFASVGDAGPSRTFSVGVTCPTNIQTGSMTLSLAAAQTDGTVPTLLGNSGTATGIGVEVLDGNGNRVNANGTVAGAGFVTSTSQTWSVRFVRTGAVSAGTVRATATLNVTVQ